MLKKMWSAVFGIFVVVLTLLVGVGCQAAQDDGGVVIEAGRQVTGNSNPLRLFDIPAVAVHPEDPSTVVVAAADARNPDECGLHVSRDGGLSWTTTADNILPEDLDFCIQRAFGPVMYPAFASDGTLYVAFSGSSTATGHPNGPIDLLVTRTDDLGVTFETVTVAEGKTATVDPADYGGQGKPQTGNTWNKFPSLAVDPDNPDRVYVAWRWNVWGKDLQSLEGDVPFRPYFAVSNDGGKTWSEPIDLLTVAKGAEAYGASAPVLVVADDGTIYGFSKELPKRSAPSPTTYRLLMFKSTDGGKTWTMSVFNDGAESIGNPVPAIDPDNGNLYVVYESRGAQPPEGQPDPNKLYFTASTDGGETWTEPRVLAELPPGKTADGRFYTYYPGISVAPNGRIDVAWHDFRNDPFLRTDTTARYWDVYYAYSSDGGNSWSKSLRVTETWIDGKYGATFGNSMTLGPMGIASTNDAAYVVWPDSRPTGRLGGAEDAYFSRIRHDTESLAATSGGDVATNALWGVIGAAAVLILIGVPLLFVAVRQSRHPRSASDAS